MFKEFLEKRKNQEELPVNENLHRQLRIQVRLTPHLGCAERPVGKTKNVHQDDTQQGNAPQLIRHGFPPVWNLVWLCHQGFGRCWVVWLKNGCRWQCLDYNETVLKEKEFSLFRR